MQFNSTQFLHLLKHDTTMFCSRMKFAPSYLCHFSQNWQYSQKLLKLLNISSLVACVAIVSSGREASLFFWPHENRGECKKKLEGGGEERKRKRLRTNPSILKTPVRPRTGYLIGSDVFIGTSVPHVKIMGAFIMPDHQVADQ